MKKFLIFVYSLVLIVVVTGCNNTKEPETDKLWGMWLEVSQSGVRMEDSVQVAFTEFAADFPDKKNEIMFNEDSTGFNFRNDTVSFLSTWTRNDSVIFVKWFTANDSVSKLVYQSDLMILTLTDDTLSYREVCPKGESDIISVFVRERE